jgi:putative tryptophan/tyrosine transport system substrate-binding protein
MRRRQFLALIGGAISAPLEGSAQETARPFRLGFMVPAARDAPTIAAFLNELRLNGFIEGQNISIVPGSFDGADKPFAERATALIAAGAEIIVTGGPVATRAVQAANGTPAVIGISDDMVGEGLVHSLVRPGGNTTGISILAPELDGKRQDILMEAVPGARRMAALIDPSVTSPQHLQALQAATRTRGVELLSAVAAKPDEIAPAIDRAKADRAEALNVLATPLFFANRRLVIERTAALRLPAVYQWPETAEEGGLLGYGPRITQIFTQLGRIVVKVLRGAKPAEIPVEQPTRFEFVINLQAAKAIGHDVPAALVLRADKVVE